MENFKTLPKDIENLEKKLNELKEVKMEVEQDEKGGRAENEEKADKNENIKEVKEEEKNEKEKSDKENIKKNCDDPNKKKEIKDLENQIERYKNLIIENEKLIERKKDINTKINEIIENIYNLKTLRKKYLGIDYQNNEYYYFISVPNKIYTKNKKRKEWGYV